MPNSAIDSPEKTLVTRKASPCTVPTSPFAFACRSVGTSVTVVDSGMLRRFSGGAAGPRVGAAPSR